MQTESTIFALATPLGGAIAIIRISGKNTLAILTRIFTGKIKHSHLSHGSIIDGDNVLDDAMAVFFQAPHSYTGEDMAELHIHAGKAVAESVLELLIKCGASPAPAGEFSRRAFTNGKMQLSEAEAVMDLICSSAKRSASSAILQLSGKLSETIKELENSLTNVLAEIDAMIDYPDEMDDSDTNKLMQDIAAIKTKADALLQSGLRAHHIRDGYKIAIVGKPNVGKSSLLNTLIAEDKAIVTHIAGTTRDVIDARADFCGLPVLLYDTAGLHDTEDEVERLGIERTRNIMQNTDLVYLALDISSELSDEDKALLSDTKDALRIIVLCKGDKECALDMSLFANETTCIVSAKTGEGIENLKKITSDMICPNDENGIITNMRHIKALDKAIIALDEAMITNELDCTATDIERALRSIGEITGSSVDEDVITRIFERFCVGK